MKCLGFLCLVCSESEGFGSKGALGMVIETCDAMALFLWLFRNIFVIGSRRIS